MKNGSHNLLPRLRLQTRGWDLPYRDAEMYRRVTEWLNTFDWRVTAGYTINDSNRNRNRLCGQLGLNWDIATIEGCVVYALGQISAGNETPDWLAEFGVRRPLGHVFTRFERYGMKHDLATGDTLVSIYSAEQDQQNKQSILDALYSGRNAKALVALAKAEKDPKLKLRIVERLSSMKDKDAQDYLTELLSR